MFWCFQSSEFERHFCRQKAGWISETFPSWTYYSLPRTVVSLSWFPIICYMRHSSIIRWLTHRYRLLPSLLFYHRSIYFNRHDMFNRYRSIRDYRNLALPAILNYDTSFLWILARSHGLRFRSKIITY